MREKRMLWVLAALLTASGAVIPSASLAQPVGDGIGADAVRTMLDGYCVTCHNEGVVQGAVSYTHLTLPTIYSV